MSTKVLRTFRKLVKPEDMNPAGTLFGGRLMEWADEAAAMYCMCQLETTNIVTLKVSEILFRKPVRCGDILEFSCEVLGAGKSSITIRLDVTQKLLTDRPDPDAVRALCWGLKTPIETGYASHVPVRTEVSVLTCQFVFVHVDPLSGKSLPHKYAHK